MLIDGHRQTLLCFVLSDDVFIEERFDFTRLGKGWTRRYRLSLLVVADDLVADVDALIADVYSGTRNEFFDLVLRLTAERTAQRVVGSSYHGLGELRLTIRVCCRYSRCAITSSIKPYSLAWMADK